MKNYPNQAVNLERIRRTLEVIATERASGTDVADDGALGYALARAQAYTFRDFDYEAADLDHRLELRITQEQGKRAASQGARTFARELRRTLRDFGWLTPGYDVTPAGAAFLATASGSQEERDALTRALWDLAVDPGPSHPVRVMLRLLGVRESRNRDGLELALEANDDSDDEFERVAGLYELPPDDRQQRLGASEYEMANARKIFPSLARAAGLVIEDPPRVYRLSDVGRSLIGQPPPEEEPPERRATLRRGLRAVSPETIASTLGADSSRTLTPEEQLAARQLLAQRSTRHNLTVQCLAKLFREGAFREGSVDLLWDPENSSQPLVLVEVKTIDSDADAQVRQAYGQLAYYEYFDVRPIADGRDVLLVVATDADVRTELADYLDDHEVALITVADESWGPKNATAEQLRLYLAPPEGD